MIFGVWSAKFGFLRGPHRTEMIEEMARKKNSTSENFEKTLFKAADKLGKNIDAAEYKYIGK